MNSRQVGMRKAFERNRQSNANKKRKKERKEDVNNIIKALRSIGSGWNIKLYISTHVSFINSKKYSSSLPIAKNILFKLPLTIHSTKYPYRQCDGIIFQ